MKYLKTKAHKIFKLIIEWELSRTIFRYVIKNLFLPYWVRQHALFILSLVPMQSSAAYLKLRCFFSNQPRSILMFFKMNRSRFKHNVSRAYLTGVQKSSW